MQQAGLGAVSGSGRCDPGETRQELVLAQQTHGPRGSRSVCVNVRARPPAPGYARGARSLGTRHLPGCHFITPGSFTRVGAGASGRAPCHD